ncbi:glycosyltransferase family 4 protein [Arthrobacter sp. SO5]|uniref:glycosyltransferase family 4 protein n=1 Tax=Arthrobacter sp. SO5 TaxID=1897055 RepID=UPI001E5CAA1C|nr:glycosyltransferase family 4 protein [Arthrobacter sp. SO5]
MNSLALGGTQINAVDFASEVAAYGYESVLVGPLDTLPDGPSLFDVARERGVQLKTFDRPRSTVAGAHSLAALAKEHQADLVHVYGSWTSRPAWWGPCLMGRRPLVLTVYEMAVDSMTPRNTELIVGTKYLEEELVARPGGVRLISPPVDTRRDDSHVVSGSAWVKSLGLDPENLRIVMVTRLDEEMKATAVSHAIRAVGGLANTKVDLIIVGTGDAEIRLRGLADQVNASRRRHGIVLAGPMSDPRCAYAAADVVIGMGGSAARSLSFGKPLIVAGVAGWFRMFTPDSSAELFRNSFWSPDSTPDPVGDLRRILLPILADSEKRSLLGRYGREFAQLNFGLPAMAKRLVDTYDLAISGYGFKAWSRDMPLELRRLHLRIRGLAASLIRNRRTTDRSAASAFCNQEMEKTS